MEENKSMYDITEERDEKMKTDNNDFKFTKWVLMGRNFTYLKNSINNDNEFKRVTCFIDAYLNDLFNNTNDSSKAFEVIAISDEKSENSDIDKIAIYIRSSIDNFTYKINLEFNFNEIMLSIRSELTNENVKLSERKNELLDYFMNRMKDLMSFTSIEYICSEYIEKEEEDE